MEGGDRVLPFDQGVYPFVTGAWRFEGRRDAGSSRCRCHGEREDDDWERGDTSRACVGNVVTGTASCSKKRSKSGGFCGISLESPVVL